MQLLQTDVKLKLPDRPKELAPVQETPAFSQLRAIISGGKDARISSDRKVYSPTTESCKKWEVYKIHLWMNYAIFVVAFALAWWCWLRTGEKKPWMITAMKFHLYFGVAALFGGICHTISHDPESFKGLCESFNNTVVAKLIVLDPEGIEARIWFLAMLGVILSEYELVMTILWPYAAKHAWFVHYLRGIVVGGAVLQVLSRSYSSVLFTHLFSHVIGICISYHIHVYAAIPIFVINLCAGGWYILMKFCIFPMGPFNYNDWYHVYASIMQVALQWYLEWSGVIDKLYAKERASEGETS